MSHKTLHIERIATILPVHSDKKAPLPTIVVEVQIHFLSSPPSFNYVLSVTVFQQPHSNSTNDTYPPSSCEMQQLQTRNYWLPTYKVLGLEFKRLLLHVYDDVHHHQTETFWHIWTELIMSMSLSDPPFLCFSSEEQFWKISLSMFKVLRLVSNCWTIYRWNKARNFQEFLALFYLFILLTTLIKMRRLQRGRDCTRRWKRGNAK